MNTLRQIVSPENGRLSVLLPKEYTQQRFEVIVLPIEETNEKDPQKLAEAHRIIDRGTSLGHDFVTDFEKNREDRPLPFRE